MPEWAARGDDSTMMARRFPLLVDPATVNCEPDAVVTSVPVSLNPGGYTSGAGVSCQALGRGRDAASDAGETVIAVP